MYQLEYCTPFAVILSVMSRDIQQFKLCPSSFEQHGVSFSLVVTESYILTVDVSIACFQFPNQRTFGYLSTTQKPIRTNIVGKRGKEQTILPELPEHRTELPQVFPQKRVRLSFCHGTCRIPFARQQLMPIPYIRMVLLRVPSLEVMSSLS